MTAALPVLTPAEFDLLAKVAVIVFAVVVAVALFAWLVSRYRRLCRRDDLMALADALVGPDMERIP